jgi:tripartite-type tricarboxylate transporter receptor subunit TctC
MKIHDRQAPGALLAIIAASLLIPPASAQVYPSRAVRMVVAYSAGGSNDIVARALAQKLTESWGQPVIIDNRPGAGTVIGTDAVAKAAPDGYTLLITPPAFVINPGLVTKLPYDSLRDFAPITLINVNTADFRERLKAEGSDPVGNTPEEYAAFLRDEILKWRRVIQFAGVKPE